MKKQDKEFIAKYLIGIQEQINCIKRQVDIIAEFNGLKELSGESK